MRIILLFLLIVFTTLFSTKRELYVEKGSCNCCKCGWQSCDVCADNISTCCNKKMNFQRYTFNS